MIFFTVVSRGLIRRPVRTGLTLLGISIGIAAVVALVGISRGFSKSWETGMKARGTDVVVSNMGSSLTPKPFNAEARERIAHLPNVAATCELLVELMSVEDAQMMLVSSREWGGFSWSNLKVVSGRLPRDANEQAVVLGLTAADRCSRRKSAHPIQLETKELTVVGIVKPMAMRAVVENGSVILSLPGLPGRSPRTKARSTSSTFMRLRLPPSVAEPCNRLCQEIDKLIPEGRAQLAGEHIGKSQAYRMVHAMSWGTSLLAVLVGVLGVMNTMLMTVFERTQEICVLLALGWRRSRIIRMILWESALLGLLGGLGGVVIGAIGVRVLGSTPAIRGLLEPDLSAGLASATTAVAIAVGVGILSGLYPAWRSSRLAPSHALHA